jgi:hypothetical protein
VGSTQPEQWVPLSPGVIGQGVTLTKDTHLAPRLKYALSVFPQKMMYDITEILEDVCRFQKNLATSDMTKIPLFILRFAPCGQTVTRSKVTDISIKSVAHNSKFYQFIHGYMFRL